MQGAGPRAGRVARETAGGVAEGGAGPGRGRALSRLHLSAQRSGGSAGPGPGTGGGRGVRGGPAALPAGLRGAERR